MRVCRRTSLTSIAQMVAAQLFTSLLLNAIRRSALSATSALRSRQSKRQRYIPKSFDISPTVPQATLAQNGADDIDVIAFPGGYVSFIDNKGIMRTERAHYDPFGGEVTVPDGTVEARWKGLPTNVIDMLHYVQAHPG